jgi:hypothetical protein
MLGILSRADILNAQKNPFITYKRAKDVWGGRFFDKVKGLASKAHNVIKKGKILSRATSLIPHPAAQVGSHILNDLGYGYSGGNLRPDRSVDRSVDRQSNRRRDSYESCNKNKKISKLLKASDLYDDDQITDNDNDNNQDVYQDDMFNDSENDSDSYE